MLPSRTGTAFGRTENRSAAQAEPSTSAFAEPAIRSNEVSQISSLGTSIRSQGSLRGNSRADAALDDAQLPHPAQLPASAPSSPNSLDGDIDNRVLKLNVKPTGPIEPQSRTSKKVSTDLPGMLNITESLKGSLEQDNSPCLLLPQYSSAAAGRSDFSEGSDDSCELNLEALSKSADFLRWQDDDPAFTLLHYVAMLGHGTLAPALSTSSAQHDRFTRMAEYLVRNKKHGVFVRDKYGCTPLQLAAACGNLEMVEVLLEPYCPPPAGRQAELEPSHPGCVYINHQDDQMRFSALHGAVSHNEFEVVILLLKYGANPQVLDVTRTTAFQAAPTLGSLQELLRLVVERADEVPRPVIVQLMAVVLERQVKNGITPGGRSPIGSETGEGGAEEVPDAKSRRAFKAQQRWSKAAQMISFKKTDEARAPGERFGAAAMELAGRTHDVDVGGIIKRHFGELYSQKRHDVLVQYVMLAIYSNHDRLTQMMIDLVCKECPDVLAQPKWHETLEPLVSSYPTLFHRLLSKLQGMLDEHVRGFVRCLRPANFHAVESTVVQQRAQTPGDTQPPYPRPMASVTSVRIQALLQPPPPTASSSQGLLSVGARSQQSHAADRVKLLIYQQLVEGLRKVSYRVIKTFFEESDQSLLNDMAQFPIFAEFVGLVAKMQTAKAFDESDSSRKLLLELLRPSRRQVDLDDYSRGQRRTPAGPPVTTLLPPPAPPLPTGAALAWSSPGSRKLPPKACPSSSVSVAMRVDTCLSEVLEEGTGVEPATRPHGARGSTGLSDNNGPVGSLNPRATGTAGAGAAPDTSAHVKRPASHGDGGGGGELEKSAQPGRRTAESRQRMRLSLQTLNVEPVLEAAVMAGKAHNVEATVLAVTSWVDTNSTDGKVVFLSGVTPELIKKLALRFPSSCATLLNVVSREVLEALATLQVSASMLYRQEYIVKSSHVRNAFTWQEQELLKLLGEPGYTEDVVDALVDYGVPFECIYKAALEMGVEKGEQATPEHFAKLIAHEFSGPELKLLISNSIRFSKVIRYIEECDKPPPDGIPSDFITKQEVPMSVLIRDMLQQKLNPRIVDIILREGKMFETTRYNNFRPGRPLRKQYPEKLFVPKYTHHFVQLLLISWRRGIKNDKGAYRVQPWAKEFIDDVFEPNDPLCTKLKSAYDNKLTDTQVYIQGDNPTDQEQGPKSDVKALEEQAQEERHQERRKELAQMRQLLRIYVSNPFLIHRWPVFIAAQISLLVYALLRQYVEYLTETWLAWRAKQSGAAPVFTEETRSGTIDAAVLAFPILGFIQPQDGDILTALVYADAPSSWFQYAIVRALYGLHWRAFGRVMILLNAAAHFLFAGTFMVFFLLMLRETAKDDHDLKDTPAVQGVLCAAVVLSASMLLERCQELLVLHRHGSWVTFSRYMEIACHVLVWTVAGTVWAGRGDDLIPALSGCTMLLLVGRLTLFGLVTEKLSTAVLALLEILSDSRYFFLLIALVYAGFILAVAGLRHSQDSDVYAAQLFGMLLGDFQTIQSNDGEYPLATERLLWRFSTFSLILRSVYGILMLIVFMNLLIATMNDTYDRAKEFCEVEVMRLRSHMMVFVKDFMKRNYPKGLDTLKGDVLHLLLRPEETKSGRWSPNSTSNTSEFGPWMGRLTYLRTAIAQEVRADHERGLVQLAGIEQRLMQMQAKMDAVFSQMANLERRLPELGQQASAVRPGPPGLDGST